MKILINKTKYLKNKMKLINIKQIKSYNQKLIRNRMNQ